MNIMFLTCVFFLSNCNFIYYDNNVHTLIIWKLIIVSIILGFHLDCISLKI